MGHPRALAAASYGGWPAKQRQAGTDKNFLFVKLAHRAAGRSYSALSEAEPFISCEALE